VDIDGTHNWCANYCPTGYASSGSAPNCDNPTTTWLIYDISFNAFSGTWENNNITLASSSVAPAKNRGQYFNGTGSSMQFSDFTLAINFSVLTWLRLDDLSSEYSVFSKDRSTAKFTAFATVFRAYVAATSG
jgi:hypothetical protein